MGAFQTISLSQENPKTAKSVLLEMAGLREAAQEFEGSQKSAQIWEPSRLGIFWAKREYEDLCDSGGTPHGFATWAGCGQYSFWVLYPQRCDSTVNQEESRFQAGVKARDIRLLDGRPQERVKEDKRIPIIKAKRLYLLRWPWKIHNLQVRGSLSLCP